MANGETGNQQERLVTRAANQQQTKDKSQMVITGDDMRDTEAEMARKNLAESHIGFNTPACRAVNGQRDAVHALGGGKQKLSAVQCRVFLQRQPREMHMTARQIEESVVIYLDRRGFVKAGKTAGNAHIALPRRGGVKAAFQRAPRLDLRELQMRRHVPTQGLREILTGCHLGQQGDVA